VAYDVDPQQAGKRCRRIKVEVLRPDLTVTTVRGFTAARDNFEALRRDLLDDGAQVRADAVYELSFLPSERSLPSCSKAAADPDEKVRDLVARGLGRLGDEGGMPALVDLMGIPSPRSEPRRSIPSSCSPAGRRRSFLGEVVRLDGRGAGRPAAGEPPPPPWGASAMSGRSRRCRQRSATAVGRPRRGGAGPWGPGAERGITPLRAVLSDPVPEVREAAARAIVTIADPRPAV